MIKDDEKEAEEWEEDRDCSNGRMTSKNLVEFRNLILLFIGLGTCESSK